MRLIAGLCLVFVAHAVAMDSEMEAEVEMFTEAEGAVVGEYTPNDCCTWSIFGPRGGLQGSP